MFILVISEKKMSEDMFVCFLFVDLKLCNCGPSGLSRHFKGFISAYS